MTRETDVSGTFKWQNGRERAARDEPQCMPERPGWWHERAQTRRRLLDVAVERLRASLGTFAGVRGALVFGSYARGDVGPGSDLDVIVVRETDLPQMQRDDDIRARLRLGVPYDLVTLTPEQFDRLPRERTFYAQALREGLWIDAARPQ